MVLAGIADLEIQNSVLDKEGDDENEIVSLIKRKQKSGKQSIQKRLQSILLQTCH